jgi:alkylhydroperoxidase family enzyme
MGHTEMLLAVAGLDKTKLDERTQRLSSTDWSTFPAEERAAFFYARKLSQEPWSISDADYDTLEAHLGVQAIDVVWWASRCHYMTRVADAFQIPLERENVFE